MTRSEVPEFRGSSDPDAVELLRALVAVPSVNPSLDPNGAGEAEIAALCAGWLREWGFDVDVVEPVAGRPSVVARHGSGSPALLLNGHLDTVGVAGMTVAPFEGALQDGRIHGRGSCDMKGGVASLLAAAQRLARRGHGGELIVALTADEEHASLGMESLVEGGLRADAAVVCEPTNLAVMPAHKGFVWVELEFRGRAAHGSRPEVGVDAIRHAGRFLHELGSLEAELAEGEPHPLLGHGSIHAGTIEGGSAPSVYPARCTLLLERRTLPGERADRVMGELAAVLDGVRADDSTVQASQTLVMARPGTEVPSDHPLVRGLLAAAGAAGVEPRIKPMTAWVDAAWLNEVGVPAVCFGPGSIEHAHAADEWVDVEEVRTCARVLEDFGRAFLQGSPPSR